jgi:hypothetical protein
VLTAGRSELIAERFDQTGARSGKMDARSGPTFVSIARIVVREARSRNYARIGLRSEVTVVRSEETIGNFAGIDATCAMTFVIFDAIVVMLAEVDGGDWLGQTSM